MDLEQRTGDTCAVCRYVFTHSTYARQLALVLHRERWLQAPAQGQGQPGVPLVITTHWTLDTAADTRILSLFAIHPKYNHWLADSQF